MTVKRSLDIGCGLNIRNPFNMDEIYGIDIRERAEENILTCDLAVEAIPFPVIILIVYLHLILLNTFQGFCIFRTGVSHSLN